VNHYLGLLILSLAITSIFTFISAEAENRRLRYFLTMFGYLAAGSLLAAWLMRFIPW
jgi:hypothetical protein